MLNFSTYLPSPFSVMMFTCSRDSPADAITAAPSSLPFAAPRQRGGTSTHHQFLPAPSPSVTLFAAKRTFDGAFSTCTAHFAA